MSRSIKKNPIVKDNGKGRKENKAIANRTLRRRLNNPDYEIADNSSYKKHYEQYDICDFVSRWTLDEALETYRKAKQGLLKEWNYFASEEFQKKCPTEESFINYWKKMMIRK